MKKFKYIMGTVNDIGPVDMGSDGTSCCNIIASVTDIDGSEINVLLTEETYLAGGMPVNAGDQIAVYYDANAPMPLMMPPQYRAVAIGKSIRGSNFIVDTFDSNLISSDGSLQLNINPRTQIKLKNGQNFTCSLADHVLAVTYTRTTRSVPAQTTPTSIVVLCM